MYALQHKITEDRLIIQLVERDNQGDFELSSLTISLAELYEACVHAASQMPTPGDIADSALQAMKDEPDI